MGVLRIRWYCRPFPPRMLVQEWPMLDPLEKVWTNLSWLSNCHWTIPGMSKIQLTPLAPPVVQRLVRFCEGCDQLWWAFLIDRTRECSLHALICSWLVPRRDIGGRCCRSLSWLHAFCHQKQIWSRCACGIANSDNSLRAASTPDGCGRPLLFWMPQCRRNCSILSAARHVRLFKAWSCEDNRCCYS